MVKISNYHKTLDKLQYVPVASTGLGLYFLYKKAVYNFETQSQPLDPERFYYVEDKSLLRCITLLVPVLGNIAVTFFDYLTGQFSDKEFWLSLVTDHDFNQKTDNYQGKLKRAPLSLRQNGEFMLKAIEKNHLAFEDAHISLKNDPTFFKSVVKIVSNKLAIYIQNRIKCCIIRPNDEIDLNIDNAIKSSLGFLEEMFEQCDRKIKSDWDFFVELAPLYGASILNYADESIANIFFVLQIYELADCKIITPTEILSKLNLPTLQSKINLQSYLRADGEIITPTKILSKLYLPTQQSRISLPSYLCTENIFKLCDEKIETLKNENKLKALSELPSVHKNFFFWNTIARNDINLFKSLCPSSLLDDLTFWENLAKNPHFLATTILSAPEKLKSNKLFWEKMAFKSKDILKLLPENLKLNEDLYLITVKTHFNTTESEQAMLEVIPDEVLNLELFCSELYSCRSYKLRATHNTSVQDSIEDNAKYSEILKNLIPSQELIIDSVPESVEDNTQFWIGLIKPRYRQSI